MRPLGQGGGQVAADDAALAFVGHHGQNAFAVRVDGPVQRSSLARYRCQHYMAGRLQVVLVLNVGQVGFVTVGLGHYLHFELLGHVVE